MRRGGPSTRARLLRAKDHCGEVALVPNARFDLGPTIFRNVGSPLARAVLTSKLSREPFWREAATARIERAFSAVPRAPDHDEGILAFMNEECDFAMEHADGSFMDHLQFCYEYCAAHYRGKSPRVLLLHSVLGVGTNYFPCDTTKIPALRALLTPEEFVHVEAFPSLLRLIVHGDFQGRKRVIQRRFNVGVLEAIPKTNASTL